jgi:hypothetical protein
MTLPVAETPVPETPKPLDHSAPASKEVCKCQKCDKTFLKEADLKAHHRSTHQMEGLYTVYGGNSLNKSSPLV